MATNIWLVIAAKEKLNGGQFINGYAAFSTGQALLYAALFGGLAWLATQAAANLHDAALAGVSGSTMAWIESQPVGRILSRFSSDIRSVDVQMANVMVKLSLSFAAVIISVGLIAQSSWFIFPVIIVNFLILLLIFKYYQRSNIEMKRLVSLAESARDSKTAEVLNGMSTIKAFGVLSGFVERECEAVDHWIQTDLHMSFMMTWIQFRIGILSCLLTLAIALVGTYFKARSNFDAVAAIGLALTATGTLNEAVYIFLMSLSLGEAELNAVERLTHYATSLEQEPAMTKPDDPAFSEWPTDGHIQFSNVKICYPSRPDKAVIQDFTVSIEAGEKVLTLIYARLV